MEPVKAITRYLTPFELVYANDPSKLIYFQVAIYDSNIEITEADIRHALLTQTSHHRFLRSRIVDKKMETIEKASAHDSSWIPLNVVKVEKLADWDRIWNDELENHLHLDEGLWRAVLIKSNTPSESHLFALVITVFHGVYDAKSMFDLTGYSFVNVLTAIKKKQRVKFLHNDHSPKSVEQLAHVKKPFCINMLFHDMTSFSAATRYGGMLK